MVLLWSKITSRRSTAHFIYMEFCLVKASWNFLYRFCGVRSGCPKSFMNCVKRRARLLCASHKLLILLLYFVLRTRRFAPRAAYATRYACRGGKNSVKRKKKSPCFIVSANWRLENAKSPAAMLQENNPQTPYAWVHRVCTWYLVAFVMYIYMLVSKLVTMQICFSP